MAVGKQLQWNVLVIDCLAPNRISADSVCNPRTATAEPEDLKSAKYRDLINDGYNFQRIAF